MLLLGAVARVVLLFSAAALGACELELAREVTTTVELGLADVPEKVASISVFVAREGAVITSATVSPEQTEIAMGVPAEVPLDFGVVARSDSPGPVLLGRMPAYAGSVARAVPLRSEPVRIVVTVYPAGALTVLVPAPIEERDEPVRVRLTSEGSAGLPVELLVPESAALEGAYALPSGIYRPRVIGEDVPYVLDAEGAITVLPDQETVYPLTLSPAREPVAEDAPVRVAAVLSAPGSALEAPDRLRVPAGGASPLSLQVAGADARGAARADPAAEVAWSITPGGTAEAVDGGGLAEGVARGLPAEIGPLTARGTGRATVMMAVTLSDGRELRTSVRFNILSGSAEPAEPSRVGLVLESADSLRSGTELAIEVLDAAGLLVQSFAGQADFSASDRWIDLAGGPTAVILAADRGVLRRSIALPSGPRGVQATLRLTVTATPAGLTLTATRALPSILDLP
ncbi:MAG: hypothetical protein IT384_10730 [Deltaproteobacteria bacterium]|nr:hypothetical protein [Deltaproteobacteria bacterium]